MWWLLAACSGNGGEDTGTGPEVFQCDPALALGNGLYTQGTGDSFTPLQAGDPLYIDHGFQGGEHVWFGARVTGPGPNLIARGKVFDERTGAQIAGQSGGSIIYVGMEDFDGCDGSFWGGRAFLSGVDVCTLDGAPLRLEVEVQDFDGEYVYSGVGRGALPSAIDPDATASISGVGQLSDYVRACVCGQTTDTGYGCYY